MVKGLAIIIIVMQGLIIALALVSIVPFISFLTVIPTIILGIITAILALVILFKK